MNREEILEKSRKENKQQDPYEQQVIVIGQNIGALTAAVLATLFFILQIISGGGMNYGLYAIVFSVPCACFVYKAIKLKRKHEIFMAAAYVLCVLMFSAVYICSIFNVNI